MKDLKESVLNFSEYDVVQCKFKGRVSQSYERVSFLDLSSCLIVAICDLYDLRSKGLVETLEDLYTPEAVLELKPKQLSALTIDLCERYFLNCFDPASMHDRACAEWLVNTADYRKKFNFDSFGNNES